MYVKRFFLNFSELFENLKFRIFESLRFLTWVILFSDIVKKTREFHDDLERTGKAVVDNIAESRTAWNIEQAQIIILQIIEECKESGNKPNTIEWIKRFTGLIHYFSHINDNKLIITLELRASLATE